MLNFCQTFFAETMKHSYTEGGEERGGKKEKRKNEKEEKEKEEVDVEEVKEKDKWEKRKARPLLWDQPSWRVRGGVVEREKGNDEGGIEKERKRGSVGGKERNRRGVVLGSTNQRQDAIDRHVAPGWFNEFHEKVVVLVADDDGGGSGGGGGGSGGDGYGRWKSGREGGDIDPFCTLRYTYW
uniref:Uncharacterized protein n=1 Tax=Vespula pensylvanica TaxID=30213 RepID=A0A834U4W4_VESPE|nr:hypothetical protein H0235_011174 [Vespula pensylvanica]